MDYIYNEYFEIRYKLQMGKEEMLFFRRRVGFWSTISSIWSAISQNHEKENCRSKKGKTLQGLLYFNDFIGLNYISDFNIIEVFDGHTALHTITDFFDIIFEAF